ncbi:6-phosphofructokinase [Fuerstiella marisgermanici]|uniref:6-phosphofructokinase n=1 Tax=Fuerstiella marisgermanici TaxID=1891926 RepID=A0A1P8WJG7_9PLAN|nr:6-phosphofructokinase [Fuerstiella marisgermanici]APZ94201.1 6-phosphofructokinase [Fuerstiella marisgermanici]
MSHEIKKVALLFSGGPAPAANAVISTCAISCINNGIDVVGIKHGYSSLIDYTADKPLVEGKDYISLHEVMLRRTRSKQGILIGTARTNPGKFVNAPEDLKDPEKIAPLKRTYEALCSLGVDALVSIGGDDTLKTANKFKLFQESLPEGSKKIPVVHVPKTIDNDYMGIDFTFGYFTAVETLGTEIRNLHADAEAGRAYFMVESMGRSAGWLAYGAAISGEASMVISVEDVTDEYLSPESTADRKVMDIDKLVAKMVRMMRYRQDKQGKEYGVIVVAEGLAEFLSDDVLKDVPRDDHGHISVAHVDLGKMFAKRVADEFERQTGSKKKVTGLQLGYESRCARPQAFDVMLGSQLGVGAYRALCEENHNGVMVSVSGQLDLHYVPFEKLVDPATLVTVVRFIEKDSDFHKLARFLETSIND